MGYPFSCSFSRTNAFFARFLHPTTLVKWACIQRNWYNVASAVIQKRNYEAFLTASFFLPIMKNERPNAQRNLLKREQSKPEHKAPNRYVEVATNSLHRIQAAYIPVNRGSQNAPPQRIPKGSGEVLERDRGFANPLSLSNRPREE